ncbi:piggyBac transposable element-derived protein 3-like [Palaemon carinicauda]|uniref:piggyBac transposable element-derived protein 3-like n=1 Tax=Palaemon carinicauda TaxID=392227 RepID=UPI0035B631D9
MDSEVVVRCLNRQGSRSPPLSQVTLAIFQLAEKKKWYLSAVHLQGVLNGLEGLALPLGLLEPPSGYHTLPSRRLYWSLDADVGVELVAKAMSRDRFEEILRFLPSTDNQALNKDDKLAKIRPLMNHLNTRFAMAYPMDQHISLDEAMIEYFGRHGYKQCIRNKPVRFGFEAWCLNSPLGYLATFDVYQGTAFGLNRHYEERFGKGGDTLMILFEKLPSYIKDIPVRFYLDNYFTSLPLVNHLQEINYGATGTIRDNRIPKTCPINSTNEMKKVPRGDTDVVVDNIHKILLVRWKDNAVVSVVSNISPVYPLESVSRWSAKDKKKISVSRPYLIGDYNRHMGGTDRMDQNINCYRISIRMKKWWWPISSWVIDATIQNCWLLHRVDESNFHCCHSSATLQGHTLSRQNQVWARENQIMGVDKALRTKVKTITLGEGVEPTTLVLKSIPSVGTTFVWSALRTSGGHDVCRAHAPCAVTKGALKYWDPQIPKESVVSDALKGIQLEDNMSVVLEETENNLLLQELDQEDDVPPETEV